MQKTGIEIITRDPGKVQYAQHRYIPISKQVSRKKHPAHTPVKKKKKYIYTV